MRKPAIFLTLTLCFFAASACAEDMLKQNFRTAPAILPGAKIPLKGLPLWHTNGELSSELIQEFFDGAKKSGFAGYTFLPVSSTRPKYLSEEYFALFGEVLETAKQNGMKIVFYDDLDFPSGCAGWTLKVKFPEDTIKRLDKVEWTVAGPAEFKETSTIPLAEKAVYGQPGGVLQAAVAMNTETLQRVDISEFVTGNDVAWSAPEGEWKIMLFVMVADPIGLVDYMCPEAVKKFITLSYDPFYERFPEHFGTTIPLLFYDDISVSLTQGYRGWTPAMNAAYEATYDKNPALDYPALFYYIGHETAPARARFWKVRSELFAAGYPKTVHEWCEKRGVKSSGHPQGPYTIQPVDFAGDNMKMHKYSDYTLFDSIHYYGHGRDGFKIPSSAAFNYDQPICVVEIYGNYRDNTFDMNMMYRSAMEIFARGGNLLLHHGTWSHTDGVYIPPEISWRNPRLAEGLPAHSDFVGRVSLMLQGGRHVADIGMLYPIDALEAYYHFLEHFLQHRGTYGRYFPQETDYLAVGADMTSRIYRDFTLIHPEVLDEKCEVVDCRLTDVQEVLLGGDYVMMGSPTAVLRLNNENNWEEYRVLHLSGADVISWANMQKIMEFWLSGGKILATTRLPSRSTEGDKDAEVCAAIQMIFGIDPHTQAPVEAIRSGQEDIERVEGIRELRDANKYGQAPEDEGGTTIYEAPIIRENAIFLPRPTTDALLEALDKLVPMPDVKITAAPGTTLPALTETPHWNSKIEGMLQYIHKVKDGRDVYFFANSSDFEAEFDVQLRGGFKTLEFWCPHTGEITAIPEENVKRGENTATVRVKLPAVRSVFVVGQ